MRSGRLVAAWLLLLAACSAGPGPGAGTAGATATPVARSADRPPATVPADWRLEYRLEGGIAGFDVRFVVDADGRASYQRNRPDPQTRVGRLDPEEVAALGRLVVESGFLELAGSYRPRAVVNDAFNYTLRWQAGDSVHQVAASDGVELPAAFLRLREAVAGLERKVLSQAGLGDAPAGGEGK